MEKKAGVIFSGEKLSMNLQEILERPDHPFFVACQFHPEFRSRPNAPHPLFIGLIQAALKAKRVEEKALKKGPKVGQEF